MIRFLHYTYYHVTIFILLLTISLHQTAMSMKAQILSILFTAASQAPIIVIDPQKTFNKYYSTVE